MTGLMRRPKRTITLDLRSPLLGTKTSRLHSPSATRGRHFRAAPDRSTRAAQCAADRLCAEDRRQCPEVDVAIGDLGYVADSIGLLQPFADLLIDQRPHQPR